jgi:biopolymer transport protein ExbD
MTSQEESNMLDDDTMEPGSASAGDTEDKTPFLDLMFLKTIALAVTLSFYAQLEQSERFALPEGKPAVEQVAASEYKTLPQIELPESSGDVFANFGEQRLGSLADLFGDLEGLVPGRVVLRINRQRSIGDVEDVKRELKSRGFDVLVEFQKTTSGSASQ